jgi:hypothetical protein
MGTEMRGWRLIGAMAVTALLLWVMYTPWTPRPLHPIRETDPNVPIGSEFDSSKCGAVHGIVEWSGDAPKVDRIAIAQLNRPPEATTFESNPNAPVLTNGRLAEALVYLDGVDSRRSATSEFPPVSVEVKKSKLLVRQGDWAGRIGLVRRGSAVDLVSREAELHSIRGRGAAFFTQMLPVPNLPVSHPISEAGVVELSSGSGYFWLRAYLFVTDHPYATLTQTDGSFDFGQVPDGEYEVVCWVPNWHIERLESDPELSLWGPVRLYFRPGVEKRQRVVVRTGKTRDLRVAIQTADFK